MILSKIPDKFFEIAGTVVGLSCSAIIGFQIQKELATARSTTLSLFYVLGYLLIFIFWIFYGIKFKRVAMWLTNSVAAILQAVLVVIVLGK